MGCTPTFEFSRARTDQPTPAGAADDRLTRPIGVSRVANAFHSRPRTWPVNNFGENLVPAFYQDRLTKIRQPFVAVLGLLGGREVLLEGDVGDSDRRTCPALAC